MPSARIGQVIEVDQALPLRPVGADLAIQYGIVELKTRRLKSASESVSMSGGGDARVSGRASHPEPFDRARVQWEMTCVGFCMTLGSLVSGAKGATLGGVIGYVWSRRHWSDPGA
jgi:hypothetical protein